MTALPLEREAVLPRIDGIRKNLARLRELGKLPLAEFSVGDPLDLAQHHLRLALEGIFHIGAHILSRLPGSRAVEYKEIATKLGEAGVVDSDFAKTKLVAMAKLRNLLVHHYADINPQILYTTINEHLGDAETFLEAVKRIFEHPEKFNLTVS